MSNNRIRPEDLENTPKPMEKWQKGNGLSDQQAMKLIRSISSDEPSLELIARLKQSSIGYVSTSALSTSLWPSAAEQRDTIKKVMAAAQQMELALSLLYVPPTTEGDKVRRVLAKISRQDLQELQTACNEALPTIRKSGREPKIDRQIFVENLASIFEEATGEKPARSKDTTNNPSGKFHNFVDATLKILNSPEWQGIDDVIKTVVKKRG